MSFTIPQQVISKLNLIPTDLTYKQSSLYDTTIYKYEDLCWVTNGDEKTGKPSKNNMILFFSKEKWIQISCEYLKFESIDSITEVIKSTFKI